MPDPKPTPSFPLLLQRFFVEHLGSERAVSPRTIAAYRDTFRLLLSFAEAKIGKAPGRVANHMVQRERHRGAARGASTP